PVPLTTYPGRETHPSFSPEGDRVAFAWEGENRDNWDIYVKLIGQETPLQLTDHPAEDTAPAWSPDGKWIAFERRDPQLGNQLVLISSIGGGERTVVEGLCGLAWRHVAWHPGGEHLVVSLREKLDSPCRLSLISLETGETSKLTQPAGAIRGDVHPAVSPDGRRVAFRRSLINHSSEIYAVDLLQSGEAAGEPRNIAAGFSPVWTADGKEIVFASGGDRPWKVSADGSEPRPVAYPLKGAQLALSPAGDRAAFVRWSADADIWQARLPDGADAMPLISSTYTDILPVYSPDGSRIAFSSSRSGYREIWVSESDGSNPVQLTKLKSALSANPYWSPDGSRIVFESLADNQRDIFVADANGAKTERLTNHPSQNIQPSWSRDGRWIYFSSNRSGERRIWKLPAEGGEPVPVTAEHGYYAAESVDGRTLYFADSPKLWGMPIDGGEPALVLEGVANGGINFTLAPGGVYFVRSDRRALGFYDFRSGSVQHLFDLPHSAAYGISIAPDADRSPFTQRRPAEADIMLVEGFE
ncbi:MAG: hypothetical protein GY953_33125, partial [bacterium]|nr:hypothetical protein [bacterium]